MELRTALRPWLRPALCVVLPAAASAFILRVLEVPGALVLGPLLALGSGSAGLAVRRAWLAPARFQRAEAQWEKGGSPEDVLRILEGLGLVSGELGYRASLLKSRAAFALGQREASWRMALEASLLRLPFWQRWPLLRFLRRTQDGSRAAAIRQGEALLLRHPHLGRLLHLVALLHFQESNSTRAWELLTRVIPGATEDPLLLEDLLLTTLHHIQNASPLQSLRIPEIFEAVLPILLYRHGDPRLPWDRTTPARYLLEQSRQELVLALAHSLPDAQRPADLWLQEIGALRDLGDLEGAKVAVQDALAFHPHSVGLWLERHAISLDLRMTEEATQSLDHAGVLLREQGGDDPLQWVWRMRVAEFTYWNRGDAATAWELLQTIPEAERIGPPPPLTLELQVALGRFEEAYQGVVEALKAKPEDVDLLLLQADCLAGMQAWEALLPFLEHLKDEVKARGDYWNLLGLAQSHAGQKLASRDHLERAAFMEPDQVDFILDAGHACMDLGEHDRAAHHFRQVLRFDSRNAEALVQLAETRRLVHDREGARRYLRECLLHHPDHEQAQTYLAELEAN